MPVSKDEFMILSISGTRRGRWWAEYGHMEELRLCIVFSRGSVSNMLI
jgi:hypothetical protein